MPEKFVPVMTSEPASTSRPYVPTRRLPPALRSGLAATTEKVTVPLPPATPSSKVFVAPTRESTTSPVLPLKYWTLSMFAAGALP